MQIGFVGLGKMGGSMVNRIQRDSDHEVVAFDYSADAVATAEEHGASGADSLEALIGWVEDSGEGRWTLDAGIANDTPMPTLAAALFARFGSRGAGNYAAKVTAALRKQFGGHAVKTAPKT